MRKNNEKDAKNCKVCGRIFYHHHNDICPDCIIRDEQDFQKVRLFLKEFPGSKINVVEEYTGVSSKKILKYLREERLELAEKSEDFLKCLKCGKPITTGMYCSECYINFVKEINQMFSAPGNKEPTAKMHITINKKR